MNDDDLMRRIERELPSILSRLRQSHFEKYSFLRKHLMTGQLTHGEEFQRAFNALYRVRFRSVEWRQAYYGLMQREARSRTGFERVINKLFRLTGRVEASFASKLVAIIEPSSAVYDSVVAGHLELKRPSYSKSPTYRIAEFVSLYGRLNERMNRLVRHREFPALQRKLTQAFPDYSINAIRSLDLLLWQLR